jgi:hypothetical protein
MSQRYQIRTHAAQRHSITPSARVTRARGRALVWLLTAAPEPMLGSRTQARRSLLNSDSQEPARLHPSVMRPVHGTVLISARSGGSLFSRKEDRKVKTTIIALSAAALVAAAPAVFAQGVSSKAPSVQHKVSKKHHPGVSNYAPRREMQVKGWTMGYPGAFGYAPGAPPVVRDMTDISPYGGSGGGGSGGGGGGGM